MIEEQDRGWSSVEKYVCGECLDDYALQTFVAEHATEKKCDYCPRRSRKHPISVHMDDLLELINESIRSEWNHPNHEGIGYESAEGGYQGTVIDTWDLIHDEIGNPFIPDQLSTDIIDSLNTSGGLWCQRNYYALPPQDVLRYGWHDFTRVIKHSKRFLFSIAEEETGEFDRDDSLRPHEFLSALARVITEVDLVRSLPAGTSIYRARVHKHGENFVHASELGTPIVELSRYSNRMSPAGIPMFYGALDEQTAIAETFDSQKGTNVCITIGRFSTARDFPVVDLTKVPDVPGLFDRSKRDVRAPIRFLQHFIKDFSAPVTKDGREHIDYVPTQVVTEYIKHFYKHPVHGAPKGIFYNSARENGDVSCALFFSADQCCDKRRSWKEAVEDSSELPKWWLGLQGSGIKRLDAPPAWAISEGSTNVL